MLINNENPFNNPVFMDEDVVEYNGADDMDILRRKY